MAEFDEPLWGATQVVQCDRSSMERDRDPFKLTGLFVQFVRSRFFNPANIRNPALAGYTWSEDDSLSRILIEPAFRYKTSDVQRRPAVLVARGEVLTVPTTINASQTTAVTHGGFLYGAEYNVIVKGSHVCQCVGQTGAEVEALGVEVFTALMEFAVVLKSEGSVGKLSVDGLGPVKKLEESQETLAVPVSVSWAYTHSWTLSQVAPILKSIKAVP